MFVRGSRVQCGTVPGERCAVTQVHGREAMRIQEKLQGMAYLYLSGQQGLVQHQLINPRRGSHPASLFRVLPAVARSRQLLIYPAVPLYARTGSVPSYRSTMSF